MKAIFFLIFSIFISTVSFADEMVIIQTVSTDKTTFVIRKGHKQGIGLGQESLFSTKRISLAARTIEVNREFSLWKILDGDYTVPFKKQQIVNYMNSIESVEIHIPEVRKRRQEFFFETKKYWYIRSGFSRTLNQNLSDAPSDTDKIRQGMSFDALYTINWKPNWEIGLGVRYDNEQEVLEQGNFALPSSRFLFMAELIYQLDYFKGKRANFYISGALGYGRSQTQVDSFISNGTASITPAIRIGWQKKYFSRFWLLFEGLVESVSSQEQFSDTVVQEANFTNAKFVFGVKF